MEKFQNVTLQNLIESAGVKQKEIAKVLGVHESTISLKISGKREISLSEAGVIASMLETTADQILYALNFAKRKENLLSNHSSHKVDSKLAG